MEYDECIVKVIKVGGSLGVVIPDKNIRYSGLKEGDLIKVMYKKGE